MVTRISKDFFYQTPVEVARSLLGMTLCTTVRGVRTGGIIVETEAYAGELDPASHSYNGPTKRNGVMFEEGGYCYVYLIYGMHYCVNVVTEKKGIGSAVLIRAIEPSLGIEAMTRRRGFKAATPVISNGPAKLCEALSITPKMQGEHFLRSKIISLSMGKKIKESEIGVSRRIGISKAKDLEWRFFLRNNPWVSKVTLPEEALCQF